MRKSYKKRKIPLSAKRLKECREDRHLTQAELAEMAGYETGTISAYETGARSLTKAAYVLAKALNVRPEYLLCKDDIKTAFDYPIAKFRTNEEVDNRLLLALEGFICGDQYENDKIILWKTEDDEISDNIKYESALLCTRDDVQEIVCIMESALNSWYESKLQKQNKNNSYAQQDLISYLQKHISYDYDPFYSYNYADLAQFLDENYETVTEEKLESLGLNYDELLELSKYVDTHTELYNMISRLKIKEMRKKENNILSTVNDMPDDYKLWEYKELTDDKD